MRAALDLCLLTDTEMQLSVEEWSEFPDAFPSWSAEAIDEADSATDCVIDPIQFVVPHPGDARV